jgi:hypothetical protein
MDLFDKEGWAEETLDWWTRLAISPNTRLLTDIELSDKSLDDNRYPAQRELARNR